jgi:hypothetical protein|tara:strand:- start:2761 stop:3159 length:399 start_codon:yes stop_codon:yes gene_type:complete
MNFDINDLVEITIGGDDDFLKIRETLTRIGIASRKDKTIYQSCHILHKRGKYFIIHFKELFALDGKPFNMTEDDIGRRNTIARLLSEWKLVTLVNPDEIKTPQSPISKIKVLPHKEKEEWELVSKYNIGRRH